MNKQERYITMHKAYNSSANKKTTMCKPMNEPSSRLTPTTSHDSWLLLNPRKQIFTRNNSFIITISWLSAIIAHFYLHLDSLSADVLPYLHISILIWIHYQLVFCHHCTLQFHLDLLSTGVLLLLHITLFTCMHYQLMYYHHHCTLQSSRGFTFQPLCWHYSTLLSSSGFTIKWCNTITTQAYRHLHTLSAHVLPSLHIVIFTWVHYQLVYCHYCTMVSSYGISAHVNTQSCHTV
jgi:hypothetical protein